MDTWTAMDTLFIHEDPKAALIQKGVSSVLDHEAAHPYQHRLGAQVAVLLRAADTPPTS